MRSHGKKSSWLDPLTLTSIHNPGHLAHSHAMLEERCDECHVGEKAGAFTRNVTDDACLKCHDAAIHRENQKIAKDKSGVSLASLTLAIEDVNHPFKAHSAGCVDCHTEHKGEAALLGADDHNCIVCHQDLKAAAADASKVPDVVNVTTAFAAGTHPRFGRALTVNGKWVDTTKIKFNHKFHLNQVPAIQGAANNCTLCHSTQVPAGLGLSELPPFGAGGVKPVVNARNGDDGYMRPVSYAEACSGCHQIKLDAGIAFSHVEFPLVRGQMADLGGAFRAKFAAMTPEQQTKELTPAASGGGGGRGRRGAAAPAAKPMTEDEWVDKQLKKVKDEAGGWLDTPAAGALPQIKQLQDLNGADTPTPDRSVLEAYVAFGLGNSCAKCHEMNGGTMPALMSAATTQPAVALDTVATGIPTTARHWFANSRFDHRPHREMSCVDCHQAALSSGDVTATATADVLSPDLDRFAAKDKNCIDCHKPGGAAVEAASGNCISCHVFHDRSKERLPDGRMAAPATQPAPVAMSDAARP